MIGAALASETHRLWRNRSVLFWAFGLPALATFLLGLVVEIIVARSVAFDPPSWAQATRSGLQIGTNVLALAFFLSGAAVTFAGDYRWGTWRALSVRCGRFELMLAKMLAFGAAATIAVVLCGVASFASAAIGAAGLGHSLSGSGPLGVAILALTIALAGSLMQILLAAALAALVAVLTRSLLSAMLTPFVSAIVLSLASSRIAATDSGWAILLPPVAGRGMQDWSGALLGDPDARAASLGGIGAFALMAETSILFGVAIWLFVRQDLSKE